MLASGHPRCFGYDVADVDRFWGNASESAEVCVCCGGELMLAPCQGYIADVAFYNIHSDTIPGLNWRLMLASAMVPPIFVCSQVYFCPESPRWYMMKNRHAEAFESLARLRHTRIQAARDIFYMKTLLEAEAEMKSGRNRLVEMFTVGRNRRAVLGSEIVMFMQQFCGVNVIAYYSSNIFRESGFSAKDALLTSMGFGIINFLFGRASPKPGVNWLLTKLISHSRN